MSFIGNLIWFIFGGLELGLGWCVAGFLWCCTIIGIPVGLQCFKMAGLAFWPFGKEIYNNGKASSFLLNLIWFFISGIELALGHFIVGIIFCCTIIGIPFGKQHFKLGVMALMPFGTTAS